MKVLTFLYSNIVLKQYNNSNVIYQLMKLLSRVK